MATPGHAHPDRPTTFTSRHLSGVKETIESVIVAFILAFVFRGFVLEAYVIPTGSMATTLYGEHATHVCSDCGWQYTYGFNRDITTGKLRDLPTQTVCPNCGYIDTFDQPEALPPAGGDRILVLKWPFDIRGDRLGPHRWDVIVFKNPANNRENFIKRLVGLPNEILEIIDGDIYTAPADGVPKDVRARMERIVDLNYQRRVLAARRDDGKVSDREYDAEQAAINGELAVLQDAVVPALTPCLKIARKREGETRAQQPLWTVVFNQDYLPHRQERVGWKPYPLDSASAWDTSQRTVRFDGLGRGWEAIRLAGRTSTTFSAYNTGPRGGGREDSVPDLRLRTLFTPLEGKGTLRLKLTKYDDDFTAELNVGDGTVTLTRETRRGDRSSRTPIGTKQIALAFGRPVDVSFVNLDYRVCLRIDGQEILATDDTTYAPDIPWLRSRDSRPRAEPSAEIAAEDLRLELRHLALERDAYYTNVTISPEPYILGPDKRRRSNPFCTRDGRGARSECETRGWGTEGNPILLRAGEYFVLGDNSTQSKDSRMWWEVGQHLLARGEAYQVGTVPEDQLLGQAFFVYWPAGYRPGGLERSGFPRVIPDVGRMRWIR